MFAYVRGVRSEHKKNDLYIFLLSVKIVLQPLELLPHSSVLIPLSSRLYISAIAKQLLASWRLDPGAAVT